MRLAAGPLSVARAARWRLRKAAEETLSTGIGTRRIDPYIPAGASTPRQEPRCESARPISTGRGRRRGLRPVLQDLPDHRRVEDERDDPHRSSHRGSAAGLTSNTFGITFGRARRRSRRGGGRSMVSVVTELRGYLIGWKEYFRLTGTPGVLRDLDGWVPRRLRAVQLKQWERGRRSTESCARVMSRSAWRGRPPPMLTGGGEQRFMGRSTQPCPRDTSTPLEFRGLRGNLILSNPRMRTRRSGGVGGGRTRCPLSRLWAAFARPA